MAPGEPAFEFEMGSSDLEKNRLDKVGEEKKGVVQMKKVVKALSILSAVLVMVAFTIFGCASASFYELAQRGDWIEVQNLIDKGVDVNAKGNDGKTALMHAVEQGNKEIVQALIVKGADVNAKGNDGKTALMHAVEQGNKEIVQALIAKGADVNAKMIKRVPGCIRFANGAEWWQGDSFSDSDFASMASESPGAVLYPSYNETITALSLASKKGLCPAKKRGSNFGKQFASSM